MKTSKRNFLKMGLGAVSVGVAQRSTAGLLKSCLGGSTPQQTSGPFYPERDQADTDSDLTRVRGREGQAQGEIILIDGVVTDSVTCQPVANALVEIWQACHTGRYNHSADSNPAALDPNFQYWGKSVTDSEGRYQFKTILPGAYPATSQWVRPAHIHYRVQKRGFQELVTQLYFEGTEHLETDRVLLALKADERKKVIVPLKNEEGLHRRAQFDLSLLSL